MVAPFFVALRVAGKPFQEAGIVVGTVGVINDGVNDVRRGGGRSVRKTCGVIQVERDRIRAVLKRRIGKDDRRCLDQARRTKKKISVRVRRMAVQIERLV